MWEETSVNGASVKTSEGEIQSDDGEILEAESSLREGLSLNYEEARALLGRLEYHRGNIEAALRVFDGIDLHAAIHRLQSTLTYKLSPRKNHHRSEHSASHLAASLVLEAIYLKARSLQKLGRISEAAQECKNVLDAVDKMFRHGIKDVLVENKLRETVRKAVELLPELWKQAGKYQEALVSYRRALLGCWNLEDDCCLRIQKRFAALLLYGGVEAGPPSLGVQIDGSFIPKNNLEEAILLLMILLEKSCLGQIQWDPLLMDHITFALSQCNQTNILSSHIEKVLPGILPRRDRWYTLSLCLCGADHDKEALNLLRKILNKYENPGDLRTLLLAAKICSKDCLLASEGIYYSQNIIAGGQMVENHLKSAGLHYLGICLAKKSKAALSAQERGSLQAEAISSLEAAVVLDNRDFNLIFDLGIQYAEQCNTQAAIQCAKIFIDATGGAILKGWRLLALLLSSQQRYLEAEAIIDATLDETSKWEQGPLLKVKARIKVAESLHLDAIDAYRLLLALVQAQRKSGCFLSSTQIEDVSEFEVWQDLAYLYSSLSLWKDVEACLSKAIALKPYAASTLHSKGSMYEARSETQAALEAYSLALFLDPDLVPCKVSMGSLLWRSESKQLVAARSILSDALRLEPLNRKAWYFLGMIHKDEGRHADAADCFLAASMLQDSQPVEGL